jgi:transcriptional regulator with GAF, ATPase, and Fis domain
MSQPQGGYGRAPDTPVSRFQIEQFLRALSAISKRHNNIHKLFFTILKKVNKLLPLSTAVLVSFSHKDNSLRVIDIKKPGYTGESLSLILPDKQSLLHSIFRKKEIFTENDPLKFDGNFLEKKLLFDNETKAVAVCPIWTNSHVSGLICFTSTIPQGFDMLERGILGAIANQFAPIMDNNVKEI